MSRYLLAIDQGTTSSRAIVFDATGTRIGVAQQEFRQYFPRDGWVEHDAREIWDTTLSVCRQALARAKIEARQLVGVGITNQPGDHHPLGSGLGRTHPPRDRLAGPAHHLHLRQTPRRWP